MQERDPSFYLCRKDRGVEYFHAKSDVPVPTNQDNLILTYHKIGSPPSRPLLKRLYLPIAEFQAQIAMVLRNGFTGGVLANCIALQQANRLTITFDDGYSSFLRETLDVLKQYSMKAIQFIVVDKIGAHNDWDVARGEIAEPLMNRFQILEWLEAGHEIGAHSATHPHLTHCSPVQLCEEVCSSKKRLEDMFSIPIHHFCYPYGDFNLSVRDAVEDAGYQTACTTIGGIHRIGDDPMQLRRYTARPVPSWLWLRRILKIR